MTTYQIEFECSNCQHRYELEIKLGVKAKGKGLSCPYCGVIDDGSFQHFRPWRYAYADRLRDIHCRIAGKDE
jgi:hypothetical protein